MPNSPGADEVTTRSYTNRVYALDTTVGVAAVNAGAAETKAFPAAAVRISMVNDDATNHIHYSLDGGTTYQRLDPDEEMEEIVNAASIKLYATGQPAYRLTASYRAVA